MSVAVVYAAVSAAFAVGMYLIAIFKIRPEPDSTGYQTNYPAGYLLHNSEFFGLLCGTNKMYYSLCLFSALCAHALLGVQLIYVKQLVYMTH